MSLCNRSNFKPSSLSVKATYFDKTELWSMLEFIIWLLLPITCLFGIITNWLVFRVTTHKSNEKELEKVHYKYMKVNAAVNIGILLIEPFTLLNACQGFITGFICSSARFLQFFQYSNIIFIKYLSNVLRLYSNFTYFGFAINRLSLVGNEQGKFVTKISQLSVVQFLIRVSLVCLGLPVVKIFNSMPNSYHPYYEYPFTAADLYQRISHALRYVYLSFELLFYFVNYFVFLAVSLVIDILLVVRMKRTLEEKKNKHLTAGSVSNTKKEAKK